jgi:hypothetical protein
MQTRTRYLLAAAPATRCEDRRIDAGPRLFPRRSRSEIDAFCARRGVGGRAASVAAQPRAGWPRPPPPARPGARARTHGGSRPRHHDPRLASRTLPSTPPVQQRDDPPRRSAPGASHRLPGDQSGVRRDHQNRASPRRGPTGRGCALSRSRGPAPHNRQRPKHAARTGRTTIVAPGRIVATGAGPATRAGPTTRTDAPTHPSIRRYAGVAPAPARSLRPSQRGSADRRLGITPSAGSSRRTRRCGRRCRGVQWPRPPGDGVRHRAGRASPPPALAARATLNGSLSSSRPAS